MPTYFTKEYCSECRHKQLCFSNQEMHAFAALTPLPVSIKTLDGKYRFVNGQFAAIFGKSCQDIIGLSDSDLYPPELADQIRKLDEEVKSTGNAIEKEQRFESLPVRDFKINLSLLYDHKGVAYGICSFLKDITSNKQQQDDINKISKGVEYSPCAVIITDLDARIEYVNPKFTDITGYSKEEVLGKTPSILHSGETDNEYYRQMWSTISSGGEWKSDIYNKRKDGRYYWARNSISGIKNQQGEIISYIAIQDDVTREHELSEELSYQSSHDELTGLINRREFEQRANGLLSHMDRRGTEHAMCYMDIDQFKIVNDTSGHIAGDELLRQVGRLLQNSVRHQDTLARLGGDEFGLLMRHCSLEQAQRVVNVVLKNIQEYQFQWEGQTFRIGISIGLVAITDKVDNLNDLLIQADSACYMAKELGRNRVHVYYPDDIEMVERQGNMKWTTRINMALDEDRFSLYAQPILSLDNEHDKHYEVLLRMHEEDGSIIMPAQFFPAAESYNLMGKLDYWVIAKIFSLLAEYPDFVDSIDFISINLGGQAVSNKHLLEFIISEFRRTGIAPGKICFEVTETVAISNFALTKSFISRLKSIGCRFALDDFGNGLSSFGYLKNLPIDYLKIDGVFVRDIVTDSIDHAMVSSIHKIGKMMGVQTIAEFVENEQVLDKLKAVGVNYAQGFGIAAPEPIFEFF
jgi:diguanylate cyclase (GGDEF)-like protein/PAS domain S-box-containing protein